MRKQSWKDKHGIAEMVKVHPKFPVEIAKELGSRGVADSVVYQQINRGVDVDGIQRLTDGRIASRDYSPTRVLVEEAVLRIMERTSVPGFWSDSSSVPGYGLAIVAHEVGLEQSKIESEFYAVMRRLRTIALEVNNDKERFFE